MLTIHFTNCVGRPHRPTDVIQSLTDACLPFDSASAEAEALFDYAAEKDDELTFKVGGESNPAERMELTLSGENFIFRGVHFPLDSVKTM